MRETGGNCEGGRVGDYMSALAAQKKRGFGKAKLQRRWVSDASPDRS